jgi:tRNA dimethylallyltransferase
VSVSKKYLVVVLGPTAIGKTAKSIALANYFNSEIISADSRQFYKEMAIGTAVPSENELKSIPHHFIHHKSVEDKYSVGDFEADAVALTEKLFKKHDVIFMVGGSGLYVDAVCNGLDEFPEVEDTIREELKLQLEEKGIEFLQNKLRELDPDYFKSADTQNPQRVIRALEVCLVSGKPFSSFRKNKAVERNFKVVKIGLTAPRAVIYQRINQRVDIMMKQGLLKEAEKLYPQRDQNALQTVGYKELFAFFDNQYTLEEAVEEIKKNTRRYAKRQLTWFRKDESIKWFDYEASSAEIITHLKKQIS